jgi:hypothetical protein
VARVLTPKQFQERVQKWADAGFDYALVETLRMTLEKDRAESAARAPRKRGVLAFTVRVIRPSATTAKRKGIIRVSLAAGSRSGDPRKSVPYASVLQSGKVYGGGTRSKRHVIRARVGRYDDRGRFLKTGLLLFTGRRGFFAGHEVMHPGSKWPALKYLGVNEGRVGEALDSGLQRRANRELVG